MQKNCKNSSIERIRVFTGFLQSHVCRLAYISQLATAYIAGLFQPRTDICTTHADNDVSGPSGVYRKQSSEVPSPDFCLQSSFVCEYEGK